MCACCLLRFVSGILRRPGMGHVPNCDTRPTCQDSFAMLCNWHRCQQVLKRTSDTSFRFACGSRGFSVHRSCNSERLCGRNFRPCLMDWPRLLVCPDRPHLLARCRAHKVHLLDGAGASAYPKLTFTIDLYFVTGNQGSNCRLISTDSRTIYGQRLFDWDCSFVDSDRIAIAYRDAYFGPKTLCLQLYDISRRQFRSCCLTAEDYADDDDGEQRLRFQLGHPAARASAQEVMADYMLKRDRLLIVSPPNNLTEHRTLTVYRLSWPLETSMTLTPVWEPKPEMQIRVLPPADFHRRPFCTRATFLSNDDQLRVFDGDGTAPQSSTITYGRFFSVDLSVNHDSTVQNAAWTTCSSDPVSSTLPPASTAVNTKDIFYCPWTSNLYMWRSSVIWTLTAPVLDELAACADSDKENWLGREWQWVACNLAGSRGLKAAKLLSWPPPTTSFAVNGQGGIYELENEDEDEDAPRFIGYIGSQRSPPTLTYLTSLCIMDSWSLDALMEFFTKSVAQLRSRGYPFCLARLAFVKS